MDRVTVSPGRHRPAAAPTPRPVAGHQACLPGRLGSGRGGRPGQQQGSCRSLAACCPADRGSERAARAGRARDRTRWRRTARRPPHLAECAASARGRRRGERSLRVWCGRGIAFSGCNTRRGGREGGGGYGAAVPPQAPAESEGAQKRRGRPSRLLRPRGTRRRQGRLGFGLDWAGQAAAAGRSHARAPAVPRGRCRRADSDVVCVPTRPAMAWGAVLRLPTAPLRHAGMGGRVADPVIGIRWLIRNCSIHSIDPRSESRRLVGASRSMRRLSRSARGVLEDLARSASSSRRSARRAPPVRQGRAVMARRRGRRRRVPSPRRRRWRFGREMWAFGVSVLGRRPARITFRVKNARVPARRIPRVCRRAGSLWDHSGADAVAGAHSGPFDHAMAHRTPRICPLRSTFDLRAGWELGDDALLRPTGADWVYRRDAMATTVFYFSCSRRGDPVKAVQQRLDHGDLGHRGGSRNSHPRVCHRGGSRNSHPRLSYVDAAWLTQGKAFQLQRSNDN